MFRRALRCFVKNPLAWYVREKNGIRMWPGGRGGKKLEGKTNNRTEERAEEMGGYTRRRNECVPTAERGIRTQGGFDSCPRFKPQDLKKRRKGP